MPRGLAVLQWLIPDVKKRRAFIHAATKYAEDFSQADTYLVLSRFVDETVNVTLADAAQVCAFLESL